MTAAEQRHDQQTALGKLITCVRYIVGTVPVDEYDPKFGSDCALYTAAVTGSLTLLFGVSAGGAYVAFEHALSTVTTGGEPAAHVFTLVNCALAGFVCLYFFISSIASRAPLSRYEKSDLLAWLKVRPERWRIAKVWFAQYGNITRGARRVLVYNPTLDERGPRRKLGSAPATNSELLAARHRQRDAEVDAALRSGPPEDAK